jgi:hypothetical protein
VESIRVKKCKHISIESELNNFESFDIVAMTVIFLQIEFIINSIVIAQIEFDTNSIFAITVNELVQTVFQHHQWLSTMMFPCNITPPVTVHSQSA